MLTKLGMSEQVRVCDTCHNSLSSGQSTQTAASTSFNTASTNSTPLPTKEDEDLAKAIAASLLSSSGSTPAPKPTVRFQEPVAADDDADLRLAIEASLRDSRNISKPKETNYSSRRDETNPYLNANEDKKNQRAHSRENSSDRRGQSDSRDANSDRRGQTNSHQHESLSIDVKPQNPNFLSPIELSNLRLFSELVEKTQQDVLARGIHTMNPHQLQSLFSQVSLLAPKLMNSLADSASKYKSLYDINTEISNRVAEYDQLLAQRNTYSRAPSGFVAEYALPRTSEVGYAPPNTYMPPQGQGYTPQHQGNIVMI